MGCEICCSAKAPEVPASASQPKQNELSSSAAPTNVKHLTPEIEQNSLSAVEEYQCYPSLNINPTENESIPKEYPDLDPLNPETYIPLSQSSKTFTLDSSLYDKIILVIGDSGSGKSSYINLIYNFVSNNSALDSIKIVSPIDIYPEIHESCLISVNKTLLSVNSEKPFTKEISLIEMQYENKKLLFVDTPGFCRSDERPDEETANLIVEFMNKVGKIDLLLYVHRADKTKFETSLKETLAFLQPSLLNFRTKVVAIYTFAGFKLDVKHDSLPFDKSLVQKKYHTINNTIFTLTQEELHEHKKQKANISLYQQSLAKLNNLLSSL